MDKEEKILSDAYDRGLLDLQDPSDDLLGMLKDAGDRTFKKDKRINVRLSSHDLLGIQRKAVRVSPFISDLCSYGFLHQIDERGACVFA